MPRYNEADMSELEREFELEMEGAEGDSEQDEELESDWEARGDEETGEEVDQEWETESSDTGDFAQRFFELAQREFESESELDNEVRDALNDMEREFFWGKKWLKKKFKKIGGRLLNKGLGHLAGRVPGFKGLKAITQIARGNLKGALGSLAKSGLTTLLSAHPAGAAALPALKALGFETTEDPDRNREAWENYVDVAREAFDYLGRNIGETALDPLQANRLASSAFQTALQKVQARVGSTGGDGPIRRGRTLTLRVRRGERIIIEGI